MNYIEIYLFLATFGFYLFNPIFNRMIFENSCIYRYNVDPKTCYENKTINVQASIYLAKYKEIKNFVLLLTTFLSPMFANFISTRILPERILALPTTNFLVTMMLGLLSAIVPHINIYYYIPVHLFLDIFGLSSTTKSLVSYYLSTRCSTKKELKVRLVIADGAFVMALAFSGLASGYVKKAIGTVFTIISCMIVVILAFIFTTTLESSSIKEKSHNINIKSLIQTLKSSYATIKSNYIPFILITIAQFIYPFAEIGALKLIDQYSVLTKFHLTQVELGIVYFVLSFVRGIGSLIIIPLLLKYTKIKLYEWCFIFLPLQLEFYFMYGLASSKMFLFLGPIFLIFQDIYQPLYCYVITQMFKGQNQAILIAFHFGLGAFAKRIGSTVGQTIYKATVAYNAGFVFLFFGSLSFASTLVGTIGAYLFLKKKKKEVPCPT